MQGFARPQPTSLVQEIGHLRRHLSEPGASTNNDRVVSGKVVDLRDWSGLINLVVHVACDLIGYQLGSALDVDLCTRLPGPLGDGRRHGFDMAVRRTFDMIFSSQEYGCPSMS